MASRVAAIADWCHAHRLTVIAIWIVLLASAGGGALWAGGLEASGEVAIPDTEAQQALDELADAFPEASGAGGAIVLRAPSGERLDAEPLRTAVLGIVAEANALDGVLGAPDPFSTGGISPDGRFALINVQFAKTFEFVTDDQLAAYKRVGAQIAADADLEIARGGDVIQTMPHVGAAEGMGVVVALIVLAVTLGSLALAGMTMLNALIGVGVSMLTLLIISNSVAFTSATPILALMLGLAVSIDYSLFITSRYRSYLAAGVPAARAVRLSVGTAGTAVVFAGLTVIIALASLTIVGIPFLSVMGLAAAFAVLVAVLVALTLLPAMLALVGSRAYHGASPQRAKAPADEPSALGFRWARTVIRFRWPIIIATVSMLVVLAIPGADMRLALPAGDTARVGTGERDTYDMISEGFGEGANGRLIAVVRADDAAEAQQAAGVVDSALQQVDGIVAVAPPQPSRDGTTLLIAVTPEDGPTSAATERVVRDMRDALKGADGVPAGTQLAVTGITAVGIDVSDKLAAALPRYLIVVVGLSMLVLLLVFRSLLVPIKATLGFLGSVLATFGVIVAVFQWGWLHELVGLADPGPLVAFLPVIIVGILFGLAMDYEVFLVSRMREEVAHGEDPQEAIVLGVGHGARVVAAAAVIMISVFAGFAINPDPVIKSMGFALALGVLIDAFIVRMTLVPAVLSVLGTAAWWLPRWMDRLIPHADIEGASVERETAHAAHGTNH